MRFDGTVGPIGHLDQAQNLLQETKKLLDTESLPTIVCAKDHCWCGLCAPKAQHKEDFTKIMEKHITKKVLC